MRPGDMSGYGVEEPVDLNRVAGPPQPSAPPPAPQPVLDSSALLAVPPAVTADPAVWGWRGRLRRLSGGLIKLLPGAEEARYRLAEVAARQYIGGSRMVMVANPKGGARTTTTTLMLAHTLAAVRGGSVVAWDNNESHGTLADRAEVGAPGTTVFDLLAAFERLATTGTAGDMSHYLRSQPSLCEVVASDNAPARREQISSTESGRIGLLLSKYFRLTCVDTGNNIRASAWRWTANQADVLVLPITLDPDVAQAAAWTLDALAAAGRADLVAGAVTVLSPSTTPSTAEASARLLEYFAARTAVVVEVPADSELAGGRRVVYGRVTEASRRAWVAVAAAVADRLAAVHSTRPDQLQTQAGPQTRWQTPAQPAPAPPASTDPVGGQASVTALPLRRAQAQ